MLCINKIGSLFNIEILESRWFYLQQIDSVNKTKNNLNWYNDKHTVKAAHFLFQQRKDLLLTTQFDNPVPVSELFKSQNQKLSYYTYKIGQVHSIYETFSVFKVHIAESFEAVPLSRQSQVDNLLTTTLFIKLNLRVTETLHY